MARRTDAHVVDLRAVIIRTEKKKKKKKNRSSVARRPCRSLPPSFSTTDGDGDLRHPSSPSAVGRSVGRSVGLRARKKVPTAEDDDDDDVSSSEFGKNSGENLTSTSRVMKSLNRGLTKLCLRETGRPIGNSSADAKRGRAEESE